MRPTLPAPAPRAKPDRAMDRASSSPRERTRQSRLISTSSRPPRPRCTSRRRRPMNCQPTSNLSRPSASLWGQKTRWPRRRTTSPSTVAANERGGGAGGGAQHALLQGGPQDHALCQVQVGAQGPVAARQLLAHAQEPILVASPQGLPSGKAGGSSRSLSSWLTLHSQSPSKWGGHDEGSAGGVYI